MQINKLGYTKKLVSHLKKILIILMILVYPIRSEAKTVNNIKGYDEKKFQTMKECVKWLDTKFPNSSWHANGMAWDLLIDRPKIISGATYLPLEKKANKITKLRSVSITCEYYETGTEGTYFQGNYKLLFLINNTN